MLRLQKFLAQAGLGSRRSCEKLIKESKVYVNGAIATIGTKVSETDEIIFDGQRVVLKTASLKVIMLNKPRGVLSSKKDEKKIMLVFDFLPKVENEPVFIKEGIHFAASFHPELTDDTTIHKMFIESIAA